MAAQPRPAPAPALRLVPDKRPPISAATMAARPPAALYIRVSSEKQRDNYSPETQEADCRAYAAAKGYAVSPEHIYYETHTATDLWERPELSRVREAIARGEVGALICHDVDRFSRKQVHAAILADECDRAGADLLFALSEFEDSATGDFLRNAKAFAAELELEKLKERTMRGMRARVQSGKLPGRARPPFGYRYADATRAALVEDPDTSWVVRHVFAELVAGGSLTSLVRQLNERAIPTPTGRGPWTQPSLYRVLTRRAYTGEAHAFWTVMRKEQGRKVRAIRPPEEWQRLPDGLVPPLIDRATFEHVQARLAHNRLASSRRAKHPEHHLLRNGHALCDACERTLKASHNANGSGGRVPVYKADREKHAGCLPPGRHSLAVRAAPVDADAWEALTAWLMTPERIEAELGQRADAPDPTRTRREATGRTLAETERRQANLLDELGATDNADLRAVVRTELAGLLERKRALEAERDALAAQAAAWETDRAWARDFLAAAVDLARTLEERGRTYAGRRELIERFGVVARVRPDGDYRFMARFNPSDAAFVFLPSCTAQHKGRAPLVTIHLARPARALEQAAD